MSVTVTALTNEQAGLKPPDHDSTPSTSVNRLEVVLTSLLLLIAVLTRWRDLDIYSGSYPEGIRAEQLLLMANGFRPMHEIFSGQGPWLLQVLYPGYALLGGTLIGVRITVVVASLVGLLAAGWVARQLGGRWAGLTALLLLTISPIYLQFSRIAVAEVLALAPATLALGCALRRRTGGGSSWVFAAGLLLAISLLIKPITLGTAPALAVALLLGPRRWRDLSLLIATTALVVTVGVLLVGWSEVVQDIVEFRTTSRAVKGWSLAGNISHFQRELLPEGVLFLALAAGGLALSVRRPSAWPLPVWLIGSAGLILAHAPLHSKHFVVVVVPLAVLAAYAIGRAVNDSRRFAQPPHRWFRLAVGALPIVLAVTVLFARAEASPDFAERDGARSWYDDAVTTLGQVTMRNDYVVTDHAYLAWAAGRLVPPGLVEASNTRVKAGSLTDTAAIDQTRQYGAAAVLLWADKLRNLTGYQNWLTEHYRPVKVWGVAGDPSPVLWLRSDLDTDELRSSLRAGLRRSAESSDFSGWQLHGFQVGGLAAAGFANDPIELVCAGDPVRVRLEWTLGEGTRRNVQVHLSMVDNRGVVVESAHERFLPGLAWSEWLIWVFELTPSRARSADGTYTIRVGLQDPQGRALGTTAEIGQIEIRSC